MQFVSVVFENWLVLCIVPSFYFVCVYFNTPGLLGLFTLLVSFLMTMSVGFSRSTWYGISVWLIYLSGLLVLFLFFCSLCPGPNFNVSFNFIYVLFLFMFLLFFFVGESEFVSLMSYSFENQPLKIYGDFDCFMVLWLGVYMLLVLIGVVKISPKLGGSVRYWK